MGRVAQSSGRGVYARVAVGLKAQLKATAVATKPTRVGWGRGNTFATVINRQPTSASRHT